MFSLQYDRIIDAPLEIVWDVISDIEAYARYAPNLSRAEHTSDGITPTRRCYDTNGNGWNQACVLWKPREMYSFVIETSASDYPYPFHYLQGVWGMERVVGGIKVYMEFRYQPSGPGLLNRLMNPFLKRRFMPIIHELMDNWETEIQRRATT